MEDQTFGPAQAGGAIALGRMLTVIAMVLAILAALASALWLSLTRAGAIDPLRTARFELRLVPPDDPAAARFDGPVRRAAADTRLPAFEHVHEEGLHKVRLTLDVSDRIRPVDRFDARRDGAIDQALVSPSLSLLLTQVINGTDIYLNGVWLAGLPKSTAEARFQWFRPLKAELPQKLLRADGPNLVTLEFTSWEPCIPLPSVFLGDVGAIAFAAELADFFSSSLSNASKAFCFLAGLFMIGVWLANRRDEVFGLLGTVSLLWAAIYTLALWIYLPPGWRVYWLGAFYGLAGLLNVLTLVFMLRMVDRWPTRRVLIPVSLVSAAPLLLLVVFGEHREHALDHFWIWFMLPFQVWGCGLLARTAWRERSAPKLMLLGMILLAGVLALHDYNVMMHPVPDRFGNGLWHGLKELSAPMYLTHLALPPMLIMMARVHLLRYRDSVERVRAANRILAETLRQREMELAVAHDQQRALERREAAQDERERIYRELHDGIGSRLVTTLFGVRDGALPQDKLERQLLDILQGLRNVISATDTREHRAIQDVFFDYCSNLEALLSGDDFQVEYEIDGANECVLLGEITQDLLRIVEETVANTLKHAHATRLQLRLSLNGLSLQMTSTDNGGRTVAEGKFGESTGRGVISMRERAERLDGRYELRLSPTGAATTLVIPLIGPLREGAAHPQP